MHPKMTTEVITTHMVPMTPEQKQWLSDLLQNRIREDESDYDRAIRQDLWTTMNYHKKKKPSPPPNETIG